MTANIGTVVTLDAADTHDLRRRVLRTGHPDAEVRWAGDDDPATFHLGIVHADAVIAISTWLTHEGSTQIRGMATEPSFAGSGLGGRLLRAGIRRATERGVELVWANARVGALRFYLQAGFRTVGDPFTVPELDIVHYRVELPLTPPSASAAPRPTER